MTNAMYQYRKCLRKRDYYNRRERDLEKRIFSESEHSNSERRRLLKSYDFWKRKRHEWSLKTADAFMRLSGVEKASLNEEVAQVRNATVDYIVRRKETASPVMADVKCAEAMIARNPRPLSKPSFEEIIGVHVYRCGLGIFRVKVEESSWDRPGRCALELEIEDEVLRITLTSAEVWSLLEFVNNSSMWTRKHNRGLYQYTIGSVFGGLIFYWTERGDLAGKTFGERVPDCLKGNGGFLMETLESITKFRDSLRAASQLVSCDNTYNLDGDRFTYRFDRLCLEDCRRGVVTLSVDARFDMKEARDEVVWLEIGSQGVTNRKTVVALDYTSVKDLMRVYSSGHLTLNEGREISLRWQNRDGWFLTVMMPKDGGRVRISTHSDMGEWLVEYVDASVMKALYDMLFKVAFLWRH